MTHRTRRRGDTPPTGARSAKKATGGASASEPDARSAQGERGATERWLHPEPGDARVPRPHTGRKAARRRRGASGDASPAPEGPTREPASDVDASTRMRDIEERLDRMIDAHARERHAETGGGASRYGERGSEPADPLPAPLVPRRDQLARSPAVEVDEFGYDPAYERRFLPFLELLYEKYFRVEVHGIDRIPAQGRCLLVANHSGALPLDGVMLRLAVRREHSRRRDVRWLAEDGIFHFPFLGNFTNRVGAVRACQENAERLLEHETLVVVFPEGKKGIGKLFRDRYKLQRFGRGGFVKLCLRTRTPIVPVAIVGGEETHPMLARIEYLTKAIGIPYIPVTPTFPLLGPAGALPAPTKWKIFFGEPIDLGGFAPASVEDEILVGRLTERVRGEIQEMLDDAIAKRRSVWFG
jgi:1-acyl-sn-glycerol-3-phosphate acyltransferase